MSVFTKTPYQTLREDFESLQKLNITLQSTNVELRQQAQQHSEEIQRLTSRAQQAERTLQALMRSTSWRVTRPLRGIRRLFVSTAPAATECRPA